METLWMLPGLLVVLTLPLAVAALTNAGAGGHERGVPPVAPLASIRRSLGRDEDGGDARS